MQILLFFGWIFSDRTLWLRNFIQDKKLSGIDFCVSYKMLKNTWQLFITIMLWKIKYPFSLLQLPFNVMYIFCFISNPICNFFAVLLYNLISLFKSLMCSKCWCQWLPWFKAIIFSSQMSSAHFFSLRIKFRINRKVSFWSEYFQPSQIYYKKWKKN